MNVTSHGPCPGTLCGGRRGNSVQVNIEIFQSPRRKGQHVRVRFEKGQEGLRPPGYPSC